MMKSSCSTNKSFQSLLRRRLMHKAFCAVDKSLMTGRGSMIADALLDQVIEQAYRQTSTLNSIEDNEKGDSESKLDDSFDDTNEEHCSVDSCTHVSRKGRQISVKKAKLRKSGRE